MNDQQPILTLIICTYNRVKILEKTLKAISSNTIKDVEIEVILINNNTNQKIKKEVENICSIYSNIHCISFLETGLSKARNKGAEYSNSKWLIYIDDDALINTSFVEKAKNTIKNHNFDCFGGIYTPWYPEGKPAWLPNDFGSRKDLLPKTGLINLADNGFLTGCIFAIKKDVLKKIGGFMSSYGMAQNIGYGEEDDLQLRLQAANYKIGFVSKWIVKHIVLPHKHHLRWHLKSAFARGRDAQRIHQLNKGTVILKWTRVFIASLLKRTPQALFRLFFQKNYYWRNAVLFIFYPIFTWTGKLWALKFKQLENAL